MSTVRRGYKAFNSDLTCRDYQFEVGKLHIHEGPLTMCVKGFHYCINPVYISNYYDWINSKSIRLFEVEVGESIHIDDKSATLSIKLIREISRDEMKQLCTGEFVNNCGTIEWYVDGKLHREDGPAVVYTNGTQQWFRNGKLHREDGPAVIYCNGCVTWYLDGQPMLENQVKWILKYEMKTV